jgi:hypothetical protein
MRPDVCGASRSARPQGFDTEDMDGLIGPKTINAVRASQLNKSLRPDGYASVGVAFKLATQTWKFLSGFIAAPVVSGGAVSDVANLWVSAGQATTSVSSAVAFAHVSATGG